MSVFRHKMLSGRVGTSSALPSGTGGDDAWGLFGGDGGTAAKPDASRQTNADPRASAHPFFASARFAWGSSDDSPFDRTAVRRALLDTVPALASRCDGRGYARLRDALGTCTSASSHEHDEGASEVIAAAVEALQESNADAGILNQCILIARGIKCLDAMDVGPSEGIEAAVLLSEAATHTANPDDTKGAEGGADTAVHAWVGTIHRAAATAAVQFRRSTKSKLHPGIKPWALMPKPAKYMGRNVYEMCNAKVNPTTEVRRVKAEDCGPAVFYNECISRSNPVVIEGIGTKHGWTALRQFCDLQWLKDTHGDTCVPVEVGKRHADGVNAHRTRWMLLSEFIDEFLSTADESLDTPARMSGAKGEHVGYVSQHSLLHQCPELQTHFTVPPQCMGRLAAANAWLGEFILHFVWAIRLTGKCFVYRNFRDGDAPAHG